VKCCRDDVWVLGRDVRHELQDGELGDAVSGEGGEDLVGGGGGEGDYAGGGGEGGEEFEEGLGGEEGAADVEGLWGLVSDM
jgi:hypothetical protein